MGDFELPWFKFYVRDWLSDERISRMSAAARAIFLDLLCRCWMQGSIPADPEELGQLVRVKPDAWESVWSELEEMFVRQETEEYDEDRLVYPPLVQLREESEERRRKLSEAGKKGAEARHSKDGRGEATAQADD